MFEVCFVNKVYSNDIITPKCKKKNMSMEFGTRFLKELSNWTWTYTFLYASLDAYSSMLILYVLIVVTVPVDRITLFSLYLIF